MRYLPSGPTMTNSDLKSNVILGKIGNHKWPDTMVYPFNSTLVPLVSPAQYCHR